MSEALAIALGAWAADPGRGTLAEAYAALLDGTVLLPVRATAVGDQVPQRTGLRAEAEAELAVLTVTLDGGRQVLPAFSTAGAMRRWRIEARPVQSSVRAACRAALDEGWTGLVVDPGSHDFVLGPAAVRALAEGFLPVAGDETVSVGTLAGADLLPASPPGAPASITAALRRGLAREPAVAAAWLLRGQPDLQVGVALRVPLDPAGLATVAARLAGRLAAASLSLAALDESTAEAAAQSCPRLWP
ncbi:MAG: hypothetical protein QOJ11_35 [Frankiales bacterium]|nr:hypothetical protein [Frankiales bacterium]